MSTSMNTVTISASAAADYSSSQHCAVKLTAEGPPPTATLCSTAGEYAWGVLQDDPAAAGRGCSVAIAGTTKIKAGAAVSFGAEVRVDTSGRAVTRTANNEARLGFALRAATAANDIIEVLIDKLKADVVVADGFIPLPLAQARELSSNDTVNLAGHGGILASDSTPILDVITAGTDQQMEVTWAASNSDKIAWHVPLPPDLDDSAAMTIHTLALMSGSTDTPTATWEAFFGVGDTDAGGATAALSDAQAEQSVTLAAANVEAAPDMLALTLTPGAHTTDAMILRAAWLEYTRK